MKTKSKAIKSFAVIITAIILLSTETIHAQGPYASLGFGYNLAASPGVIGTNVTYGSSNSITENVTGSFGEGIALGLAFGYMFTEHVGAELGFSYVIGKEFSMRLNDPGNYSGTAQSSATFMQLTPALRVSAGGNISPYAKFGLCIGLGQEIEQTTVLTGNGFSATATDKFKEGTMIGFTGAAGVEFKLNEMINVFVELTSVSQSWSPDKDEWRITDNSNFFSQTESGTITYVDTYNSPPATSPLYGVPYQQLREYLPFSTFGFGAGIKFSFGSK